MANNIFICVVVLASIFSDVQSASVGVDGSTTVILPNNTIQLKCSYSLSVNEALQTLTWKKGITTILTWTNYGTPRTVNPWAQVTYQKNTTRGSVTIQLPATNVTKSSGGAYTCTVTSTGRNGRTVSATQNVTIHYLDVPQMTLSNSRVTENSTVSMICSASSNPSAIITIAGPGKSKSRTNSVNYTFTAGCRDTGTYQCIAKNSRITTSKRVSKDLTVFCKPRNNSKVPEETEFMRNLTEFVVFKATILAIPAPVFQWSRKSSNTGEITVINNESGHFEITNTEENSQLKVTILTEDDYAEYLLKAMNTQGETTLKYFLRSGTPPYNVATLAVASVTTDSITVVWSSSFNGGAEQEYILQYLPMWDTQEKAWIQKTARISDPGRKEQVRARILDIHPSRTYRVRVFSVNMFGKSKYSNVITVTTSDLPTQIPFGVGIVVGAGIVIVIIAVTVVGCILCRRKCKPMKKGQVNRRTHENPAFSGEISETVSATGLYSKLDGERAKPPTYDALDGNQSANRSVAEKQHEDLTEPSAAGIYMNYEPYQSDKSRGSSPENKPSTDGGLYENT